jgi:hypothetical protein
VSSTGAGGASWQQEEGVFSATCCCRRYCNPPNTKSGGVFDAVVIALCSLAKDSSARCSRPVGEAIQHSYIRQHALVSKLQCRVLELPCQHDEGVLQAACCCSGSATHCAGDAREKHTVLCDAIRLSPLQASYKKQPHPQRNRQGFDGPKYMRQARKKDPPARRCFLGATVTRLAAHLDRTASLADRNWQQQQQQQQRQMHSVRFSGQVR